MPAAQTIAQILTALRVTELKALCADAGIEHANHRHKAPLVGILLDNPAAIPLAYRQRAVPPIVLPAEGVDQDRPDPDEEQARLVRTIAGVVDQVITSKLADVVTRLGALESRSERSPPPITIPPAPTTAATTTDPASFPLAQSVPLPASTRLFFGFLQQDVYDSVVNNTFDVKDLWKFDPLRQGEIMGLRENRGDAISALASALNATEDTRRQQAHGKYTDLGSLLRPWLVYAQLRSILTPNLGVYLVGYARELCRIDMQYPGRFSSLLEYHLLVVQTRLNAGLTLNPLEWTRHDDQIFHQAFSPGSISTYSAPPPPAAPQASTSQASGNTKGSPPWSIQSRGTGTRTDACRAWNNAKPCATWPCPYVHVCATCKGEGHTQKRCQTK